MVKVSAVRSHARKAVLTKLAADEFARLANGYANAHRPGIAGAGARIAANDAIRRSGGTPTQGYAPARSQAPSRGAVKQLTAQNPLPEMARGAVNKVVSTGRKALGGLGDVLRKGRMYASQVLNNR